MKKVLVSIYVLKLDKTYDVKLPINLPMKDVLELIQGAIKQMNDAYEINNNAKLYEALSGNLLNVNNIVKFSGVKNGEKLMLV